ncbi:MAG: hypothetical protein QNJ41_12485 [Xenococcaceae cyanobacterium MO_188.B32]|nr:hypothetical protein [Xenococcaceae cyanobacterium MO_188.B32]
MTTASNTDIQQIKEFIKDGFNEIDKKIDSKFNELDKKIDSKFNELDKKIDSKFNELDKKIDKVESALKQEISEVRGDLKAIDARQKNVEISVQKIPEITEKFGELKKRCDPASAKDVYPRMGARERAPRHWRQIAFIIIAAVVGWFARSGKM